MYERGAIEQGQRPAHAFFLIETQCAHPATFFHKINGRCAARFYGARYCFASHPKLDVGNSDSQEKGARAIAGY